jgi:hypothetical protein
VASEERANGPGCRDCVEDVEAGAGGGAAAARCARMAQGMGGGADGPAEVLREWRRRRGGTEPRAATVTVTAVARRGTEFGRNRGARGGAAVGAQRRT